MTSLSHESSAHAERAWLMAPQGQAVTASMDLEEAADRPRLRGESTLEDGVLADQR